MGCGNSRATGTFYSYRNEADNNARINSYLATLPKLFSETIVPFGPDGNSSSSNSRFLTTCNVSDTFKSVIFACTDTRESFFKKQVTQDELKEIREALDVNHTISWWSFFAALKHAFFNKRVSLIFHPEDHSTSCIMKIELNFTTLGRTSLSLRLHRTHNNDWDSLRAMFIDPLFEFYSIRTETAPTDKIEQLEKQIKMQKEKIQHLERELEAYSSSANSRSHNRSFRQGSLQQQQQQQQQQQNSETTTTEAFVTPTTDTTADGRRSSYVDTYFTPSTPSTTLSVTRRVSSTSSISDPSEDAELFTPTKLIHFLRSVRAKLAKQGVLTPREMQSFETVMQTLADSDSAYENDLQRKALNEMDIEVIEWLKHKYSTVSSDSSSLTSRSSTWNGAGGGLPYAATSVPITPTTLANRVPSATLLRRSGSKASMDIDRAKVRDDIIAMFDKVDKWNFDVFTLNELTEGRTLFVTAYTLFLKYDLLNKFHIDEATLINFLCEIEAGYHANPYHNAMHAADVLQVLHFIISTGGLGKYLTDQDVLAALIAATIHDYDHNGLNNAFHIKTRSYLATLYNDRSVLENHHCSQAFELMRTPQFDILKSLTPEQRAGVRETVIDMVLGTDMSQHSKIFGKFQAKVNVGTPGINFQEKNDKKLALQIAIKCADVSNPARPVCLYTKWADRVCEEFYKQGDKERELSLVISPFMDRTKPALAKGQVAFINYVVQPMFELLSKVLPDMAFTAAHVNENKNVWNNYREDQNLAEFIAQHQPQPHPHQLS